jgi:hypothetical protein
MVRSVRLPFVGALAVVAGVAVLMLGGSAAAFSSSTSSGFEAPRLADSSQGNSTLEPGPSGAAFAWSMEWTILAVHDESALPGGDLGLDPTFVSLELLWGDGTNLTISDLHLSNMTYLHAYATPGAYNVTELFTYTVPTTEYIPGQNATATYVSAACAIINAGMPDAAFA